MFVEEGLNEIAQIVPSYEHLARGAGERFVTKRPLLDELYYFAIAFFFLKLMTAEPSAVNSPSRLAPFLQSIFEFLYSEYYGKEATRVKAESVDDFGIKANDLSDERSHQYGALFIAAMSIEGEPKASLSYTKEEMFRQYAQHRSLSMTYEFEFENFFLKNVFDMELYAKDTQDEYLYDQQMRYCYSHVFLTLIDIAESLTSRFDQR